MSFIIAIDGPTSSGKSTISSLIAKELGFVYVQTGAMYRCVGLEALRKGILLDDEIQIKMLLEDINISFSKENNNQIVILNGENVTEQIRTKEVTDHTSKVASISSVRHKLLEQQRKIAEKSNIVIEGRDIGTNVFPNADVKFYLTAKPTIRARRKQKELECLGQRLEFIDVLQSIYEWDADAVNRKEGALKRAEDSIYVDSSEVAIEELKTKMIGIIKEKYEEKYEGSR